MSNPLSAPNQALVQLVQQGQPRGVPRAQLQQAYAELGYPLHRFRQRLAHLCHSGHLRNTSTRAQWYGGLYVPGPKVAAASEPDQEQPIAPRGKPVPISSIWHLASQVAARQGARL